MFKKGRHHKSYLPSCQQGYPTEDPFRYLYDDEEVPEGVETQVLISQLRVVNPRTASELAFADDDLAGCVIQVLTNRKNSSEICPSCSKSSQCEIRI